MLSAMAEPEIAFADLEKAIAERKKAFADLKLEDGFGA